MQLDSPICIVLRLVVEVTEIDLRLDPSEGGQWAFDVRGVRGGVARVKLPVVVTN